MSIFQKRTNESKAYSLYTGVNKAKVLAFNPTTEEYNRITGNNLPYELSYDANDNGEVTNKFLLEDPNGAYVFLDVRSSKSAVATSKNGNVQFADNNFSTAWGSDAENVKSPYFNKEKAKPALVGQELLFQIVRAMGNIPLTTDKETTNVTKLLTDAGIDVAKVYAFNKKEINKLIENCVQEDGSTYITVLYMVRTTNAGKLRQVVSNNRSTIFAYNGDDNFSYAEKKVKEWYDAQVSAGYPPKDHYSTEYVIFDVLAVESSSDEETEDDTMPF